MPERGARLDPGREARFWSGVAYATRFFMGEADVQQALLKLARVPDEAGIHSVLVERHRAGEYPGDGRPKPERFPDPARAAVRGARVVLLPLPVLVELKLASGMSASHRLRDLADVLELIRAARLPAALADELDPSVRDKYRELWRAAQVTEPE